MKFLQNKFFVIVLAVFAFGLVGRNLFLPIIKRYFPTRAAAVAPSTPPPAPAEKPHNASAESAAKAVARTPAQDGTTDSSVQPMNVLEASSNAPLWTQSAKRDPFKMTGNRSDGKSARDLLTLSGVLRQTESTLVVINNRVMATGDTILGFMVETVEDQCIWVTGPNGREQVEFKYSLPPTPQVHNKDRTADLSLSQPQEQSVR